MTTILLVRHGETTWNRKKRIQGWADTPLTPRGHSQATALGEALSNEYAISRIQTSDLNRTRQTAALIRESIDAPLAVYSGWRERNFGKCQGLTYDEFTEQHPELSLRTNGSDAITTRPPNGETLQETKDRVTATWNRLITNAPQNETILAVSHGGPICIILGTLSQCSIPESYQSFRQQNCAVNEIKLTITGPENIHHNNTEFHASDSPP